MLNRFQALREIRHSVCTACQEVPYTCLPISSWQVTEVVEALSYAIRIIAIAQMFGTAANSLFHP
jgi:hypothetical protein